MLLKSANIKRALQESKHNCQVCPELVFQVGVCENPYCIDSCNPNHYCATDTCPHRLVSFEYEAEYTYIEVYGGTVYKIRIVL